MKRRNNLNKFDNLVENLSVEFAKIPNFELTSTDETGKKIFSIVTFRLAEIISYKELVSQHFIPATNRAINDSKRDFFTSKYKRILNLQELDFEETLFDTIRLAYVGLFHKLENYINVVILLTEIIMDDLFETKGSTVQWGKEKLGFEIKDWQQFSVTHKINWICNCVKHKDGFPIKLPKPFGLENLDETQRIRIQPQEFKNDCDLLIKFYPLYLQVMFNIAQHKMINEKLLRTEDYIDFPEYYEKRLADQNKIDELVKEYIRIIRNI